MQQLYAIVIAGSMKELLRKKFLLSLVITFERIKKNLKQFKTIKK